MVHSQSLYVRVLLTFLQDLRYNVFFLEHSLFLLIYDLMIDESSLSLHLPWIHAGLQYLLQMRQGDPVESTLIAIRRVLQLINPEYDIVPNDDRKQDPTPSYARKSLPQQFQQVSDQSLQQPPHQCHTLESFIEGLPNSTMYDQDYSELTALCDDSTDISWSEVDANLAGLDIDTFLSFTQPFGAGN